MYTLRVNRICYLLKLYKLMYHTEATLFLTRKKENFDIIYNKYKDTKWAKLNPFKKSMKYIALQPVKPEIQTTDPTPNATPLH